MGPELDLRPQLERLDRLICWSEDIDEGALTFTFRPLWQLDEPAKAALALSRAQATQVYAGLKLWPDAVVARLAEAQLVADGTYPNAAAVFAEAEPSAPASASPTLDYDPAEPRGPDGRWTSGGANGPTVAGASGAPASRRTGAARQLRGLPWLLNGLNPIGTAQAQEIPPEPPGRREAEPAEPDDLQSGEVMRVQRFNRAWEALKELDPENRAFAFLRAPGALPTDAESEVLERAAREIVAARSSGPAKPTGLPDEPAPDPLWRSRPLDPSALRPALPRVDPRAAQKLDNALSDYDTCRYHIDDQVFQFDKAGMRYTLERHAPEYWDGTVTRTQTFFPRGTSMQQIQQAAGDVLSQNRETIMAKPSAYRWDLLGTSDGVRYGVTIYLGRITHVVPLP